MLQFLQAPDRDLTGEDWRSIFPRLLAGFDLADEAWRSVAFRLWVRRVLNYTANEVPQGYDHAISYLEKTIVEFEEVGVSSVRDG